MIFQGDSVSITDNLEESYYPYIDHIMGSASDLYNTFNQNSLDKGNDLYFNLNVGSYLICVSTTRNELLDYTVGIVVEIATTEMYFLLEDLTFCLKNHLLMIYLLLNLLKHMTLILFMNIPRLNG